MVKLELVLELLFGFGKFQAQILHFVVFGLLALLAQLIDLDLQIV